MSAARRTQLARRRAALERVGAGLDALSPLKVLGRGYAIATREDGRAIRSAADVKRGERITVRVESARIVADVMGIEEEERKK
jgi:exodeoxyribonuclease VII large subunit